VLITIAENRKYKDGCLDLIESIENRKATLIIPQIVEYELLKRAENIIEYNETIELIKNRYVRWCLAPEITNTASKLYSLYRWNGTTKCDLMNNKTIFNDLIVGATAIHWQKETKKNTYILSSDRDYMEPYFSVVSRYKLPASDGLSCLYFLLYKPNNHAIINDWIENLNVLSGT